MNTMIENLTELAQHDSGTVERYASILQGIPNWDAEEVNAARLIIMEMFEGKHTYIKAQSPLWYLIQEVAEGKAV